MMTLFGPSLPLSTKKPVVKVGSPLTKLSGSAHVSFDFDNNKSIIIIQMIYRYIKQLMIEKSIFLNC